MMNLERSLTKSIAKYQQQFLHYLQEHRGYSPLTVKSYDETLREALEITEIQQQSSSITFNLMPYRMHIAHLQAKTISKKLSAIRSFAAYLDDQGLNVTLTADESIKVARTLPKPITHEHIKQALELADTKEKLIVSMLYTLGLRISELAQLRLGDVTQDWIRVTGKGSKQRDIPLLHNLYLSIVSYKEEFAPKEFLFEKNGKKLSENSLRYTINKVFARISLKVTPHQLRHSYATALLNNGAPIADVSELLGHASMATTQIYTKLGNALKKQNYDKAHPLSQESSDAF